MLLFLEGDQRRGKKLPSSYINTSIGILQGLLIGVGASLLVIIYRNAYPPIAELGRLPGSHTYANRIRFPQSITIPGLVVVRFDGSLYFANKEHIRSRLIAYSQDNKVALFPPSSSPSPSHPSLPHPLPALLIPLQISWIVLDCSSMLDIDSTAMHVLKELMSELKHNNVQLFFACLKGPIRDAFKRWGIVGEVCDRETRGEGEGEGQGEREEKHDRETKDYVVRAFIYFFSSPFFIIFLSCF